MKRFWVGWYSGCYEDEGYTQPPFEYWITGSRERPNDGLTEEKQAELKRLTEEWTDQKFTDEMQEDLYYAFINTHGRDTATITAAIDAESQDAVWELVSKHFPDFGERFCEERPADFKP